MLRFLIKHSYISDEELRMWCIQQITTSNKNLSAFQISEEAEELFNYIKEGTPYQAGWIEPKE